MKPQPERYRALLLPLCCITVWKISSPWVFVRSCYGKITFHLCLYQETGPPPLCPDTIALASIPVPACLVLLLNPLRPPAHLARLSLSLWQCPPPLPQPRLSWQGARYVPGPATGAVVSSIMSQTSRDQWEHKGRGIWRGDKWGRGKLCSHFLSFISSWSFSPTVP